GAGTGLVDVRNVGERGADRRLTCLVDDSGRLSRLTDSRNIVAVGAALGDLRRRIRGRLQHRGGVVDAVLRHRGGRVRRLVDVGQVELAVLDHGGGGAIGTQRLVDRGNVVFTPAKRTQGVATALRHAGRRIAGLGDVGSVVVAQLIDRREAVRCCVVVAVNRVLRDIRVIAAARRVVDREVHGVFARKGRIDRRPGIVGRLLDGRGVVVTHLIDERAVAVALHVVALADIRRVIDTVLIDLGPGADTVLLDV